MDKGVVNVAVNLGWKNVSLNLMLEDELDCPISILNDVDAGVYGEYCVGQLQELEALQESFQEQVLEADSYTRGKSFAGKAPP